MSYGLARDRYASDATQTATPARLLTMLYDRLVADLTAAELAIRTGDIETAGDKVGHAQEILLELHAGLDTSAWSGGEGLAQLYLWMVNELLTARVRRDHQRVADVLGLVVPLRDAWATAAAELAAGEPRAAANPSGQPANAAAFG